MIDQAQKIDCRAFVSEKYFRHFLKKTFSAESILDIRLSFLPYDEVPNRSRSQPSHSLMKQ